MSRLWEALASCFNPCRNHCKEVEAENERARIRINEEGSNMSNPNFLSHHPELW
ncbi:MAG TPA: hypothetical protein VLG76_05855 [Rhabdochlamydiaceae bacterium]|nr:hypothetical protein [Rhabdochlamydiaceae bacterium]